MEDIIKNQKVPVKLAAELKEIENSLNESQILLKTVIESTPDLIWSVDPLEFRLTGYNQAFVNYFLNTRGFEIKTGMRLEDVLPPEAVPKWYGLYRTTLEKGSYTIEYEDVKCKKFLQLTLNVMRLNDKVFGISAFGRDITDRVIAVEKVRKEKEHFSMLFHLVPAIIALAGVKSGIVYEANEAYLRSFGFSRDEVIGHSHKELNIWANPEDRERLIKDYYSGIPTRDLPIDFRAKDGRIIHTRSSFEVLELDGEEYFLGVVSDVTELKQTERELENRVAERTSQLKAANEELEITYRKLEKEYLKGRESEEITRQALLKEKELSLLKSNFISITSHEFRTPLTSIFSSVEILQMSGPSYDNDKKNKHFNKIQRNIEYLITMIDELLYLNKIESHRVQLSYSKTNIGEFCRELFDETRQVYSSIKADFEIRTDKTEYIIEKAIMQKILGNLLTNAFKYNRIGGSVSFSIRSRQDKLLFEISDTGIGIPEAEREVMFKPFSRMSNSRHIKGTGLGLSIVKRSVEQLNGKIFFTSAMDRGTSFLIEIPVSPEP